MARTIADLDADARALTKAELPLVITAEEAKVLVNDHRARRVASGRPAPDTVYLMKKCASGKARIHGHAIKVEN